MPVSVTTGQHPDTQTHRHTDTWTHGHMDTRTHRHRHRHRQRRTCVGWSTNRENKIAKRIINYFRRRISRQLAKNNSKWNKISLAIFSPQWYHIVPLLSQLSRVCRVSLLSCPLVSCPGSQTVTNLVCFFFLRWPQKVLTQGDFCAVL